MRVTLKIVVTPEARFQAWEWLVPHYATRLQHLGLERGDLMTAGYLMLWKSCHRQEPAEWEPYLRARISGAMRDAARSWFGRTRRAWLPLEELPPSFTPRADEWDPAAVESYSKLYRCLEALNAREAELLRRHYLEGTLLQDLASEWGVSPGRVSFLHGRALKKLRAALLKGA